MDDRWIKFYIATCTILCTRCSMAQCFRVRQPTTMLLLPGSGKGAKTAGAQDDGYNYTGQTVRTTPSPVQSTLFIPTLPADCYLLPVSTLAIYAGEDSVLMQDMEWGTYCGLEIMTNENLQIRSTTRREYPHSLSYHAINLTK